ncbi:hypothetical protein ACE2AK_23385 [Rahnella perminowiae]|uniref:hypothetical protein n=1 Tax=Rahnella perminowiae TaxID=2816244 RepID=UPI00215CE851|nr:hypothetical protein [Rahnella perminowiae]MCR9003415.1 hypothetical protein [Rahnella perminowiae]MCX2943588.1 hypothetical protein [Rahnella perminowiae]
MEELTLQAFLNNEWVDIANITFPDSEQNNYHGTLSPVGNLRIKESLPEYNPLAEKLFFTVEDVKNRAGDFLDYAQQRGAAAGGIPQQILNMPAISFSFIPEKLRRWGLL